MAEDQVEQQQPKEEVSSKENLVDSLKKLEKKARLKYYAAFTTAVAGVVGVTTGVEVVSKTHPDTWPAVAAVSLGAFLFGVAKGVQYREERAHAANLLEKTLESKDTPSSKVS
ncbi:MAG TPA: hypothetical protein VJ179_00770 [Patescibacteria group bacterium]|nr:hypothetical protein [Patescibacteria group bacterium]